MYRLLLLCLLLLQLTGLLGFVGCSDLLFGCLLFCLTSLFSLIGLSYLFLSFLFTSLTCLLGPVGFLYLSFSCCLLGFSVTYFLLFKTFHTEIRRSLNGTSFTVILCFLSWSASKLTSASAALINVHLTKVDSIFRFTRGLVKGRYLIAIVKTAIHHGTIVNVRLLMRHWSTHLRLY